MNPTLVYADTIDQFALHEAASRSESEVLTATWGPRWVLAPRTKRIVERFGEDVRCATQREHDLALADHHERSGCPPRCPTRVRAEKWKTATRASLAAREGDGTMELWPQAASAAR